MGSPLFLGVFKTKKRGVGINMGFSGGGGYPPFFPLLISFFAPNLKPQWGEGKILKGFGEICGFFLPPAAKGKFP